MPPLTTLSNISPQLFLLNSLMGYLSSWGASSLTTAAVASLSNSSLTVWLQKSIVLLLHKIIFDWPTPLLKLYHTEADKSSAVLVKREELW